MLRIQPTIASQQYEITAVLSTLENRKDKRMVLFENPLDVRGKNSIPFLSNVFCTRGLCAAALGLSFDDDGMVLVEEFGRREGRQGSTESISAPPCQEIIQKGDDVDLWKLPIPIHHIKDVDVFNDLDVHWAMVTRTFWDKDVAVIPNVQSFRQWMGNAVAIIDATRPDGVTFPDKNEVPAQAIKAVLSKGII